MTLPYPKRGRVTIVTPVYNQQRYVEDTIKSVLSQTYDDIEYIIVDDGSDDGSGEIIDRFGIHAQVRHQLNRGQSAAVNRGWNEATGEFIGYISSDDLLDEEAIAVLVRALQADESLSVVYPDYRLIDGNGKLVRAEPAKDFVLRDLNVGLICQPGVGALYRRRGFDFSGGWDGELQQVADFEFFLRMSSYGGFKRVAATLASHRIHAESASFRSISVKRSDEIIGVVEKYWDRRTGSHEGRDEALANAYVISARMHARSGRAAAAFTRYALALQRRPRQLLNFRSMISVFYQLVRRFVFAVVRR